MNSSTFNVAVGLDIGNGFMKGKAISSVDGTDIIPIDYQSIVADAVTPVDFAIEPDNKAELEKVIDDIFNYLDVSFISPLIHKNGRYVFGRRGITEYGQTVRLFDVSTVRSGKANDELSSMLCLGTIAGTALKDFYAKNKMLPKEELNITVDIALAVPINEYVKEKDKYPIKFTNDKVHKVFIHNFKVPDNVITVNITFNAVNVLPEGSAAQIGISTKGASFVDVLLKSAISLNPKWSDNKVTDIINATDIVGIDLGEGTVNYAVFVDNTFSPKLSRTLERGYGSILDSVVDTMSIRGEHTYNSRKELIDFIGKPVKPANRNLHSLVNGHLKDEKTVFARQITSTLREILSKMTSVDVVYVYGGGACAMKDELLDAIIKTMDMVFEYTPVLYMDSDISRTLNCDGLFEYAKRMSRKERKDNPKNK